MEEYIIKCDIYQFCYTVKFFKNRLKDNKKALDTFMNEHCCSDNYIKYEFSHKMPKEVFDNFLRKKYLEFKT
ncbi:MAG: hypothetical protein AABW81_01130 [Nanoarchaeota archaeon]